MQRSNRIANGHLRLNDRRLWCLQSLVCAFSLRRCPMLTIRSHQTLRNVEMASFNYKLWLSIVSNTKMLSYAAARPSIGIASRRGANARKEIHGKMINATIDRCSAAGLIDLNNKRFLFSAEKACPAAWKRPTVAHATECAPIKSQRRPQSPMKRTQSGGETKRKTRRSSNRLHLFQRRNLRSFDQPFGNFNRLLLFIFDSFVSHFRCRAQSAPRSKSNQQISI